MVLTPTPSQRCLNVTRVMLLRSTLTLPCVDARRQKRLKKALVQEDVQAVVTILLTHPALANREVLGKETALERLLDFQNPPPLGVIQAVGDLMMNGPPHLNITASSRFLRKACESEHGTAPGVVTYLCQKYPWGSERRKFEPYGNRFLRQPIHIYLAKKRKLDLSTVRELDAFPNCLDETCMSLAFLNQGCPMPILEYLVDRCIEKGPVVVVLSVHRCNRFGQMDRPRVQLLLRLAAHNRVQCGSHMFTPESWLYFLQCLVENGATLKALELKVFDWNNKELKSTTRSILLRLLRNNKVEIQMLELRGKGLVSDCSELFCALKTNSTLKKVFFVGEMKDNDYSVLEEMLRNHNYTLTEVSILSPKRVENRDNSRSRHFLKLNKYGRAKLLQDGAKTKDLVELLRKVPPRLNDPIATLDTHYGLLRELPSLWAP